MERSFEELFRSVYVDLHRYVVRRYGYEGAEDICSETFATAHSRWSDAPSSETDRRRWTFGIAHHKIQEANRKRLRHLALASSGMVDRRQANSPDESVAAIDRARHLLEQLPLGERNAVYLTVILGFSAAEAGEILGCRATAVTSRVSRARSRLIVLLGAEVEGEDERVTG